MAWPRRQWFAKPTRVDGHRFASQDEAAHYQQLRLRQMAGEIREINLHPSWEFVINGVRVGKYTADAEVIYPSGEVEIVDVKGARQSRDYVLRKKLLLALYGIPVTEVRMRQKGRRVA